uniref:Uncharacterized protein n=1 Tax=Arundo donax TaxID=35708 RepID=A0A0A8ZCH9_ARUDO
MFIHPKPTASSGSPRQSFLCTQES